jgi:hypothetical protein
MLAGAAATVFVLVRDSKESSMREQAQRDCRTAVEAEWSRRSEALKGGSFSEGIVMSMTGIEMQETWATETGFSVNAVVKYDMTTALVAPIHSSLSFTCEATVTDGRVTTAVKNR